MGLHIPDDASRMKIMRLMMNAGMIWLTTMVGKMVIHKSYIKGNQYTQAQLSAITVTHSEYPELKVTKTIAEVQESQRDEQRLQEHAR